MASQKKISKWSVQDAKNRFSEFLETSLNKGPQIVTRRGVEAAVLLPIDEWRRLQQAARPTLKELLLAAEPRFEMELPSRKGWKLRPPVEFE
jgi:prevent-host-death family protein